MSIIPGAIRFNTDSMKLEYYHGGPVGFGTLAAGEWVQITTDSPHIQTGGARGVFMGGYYPSFNDVIDYITISTTGNAIDFGNLTQARGFNSQVGSRTRGVAAGGQSPAIRDTIDFVTIASTGNATDFGNLFTGRYNSAGCGSDTRGLFGGGNTNPGSTTWVNTNEYITIAQTGNAVDFGDLINAPQNPGALSSSTRGIWAGGANPSPSPSTYNTIQYVTISTLGNAADFGDLTEARRSLAGCSNSIRGLTGGGSSSNNNIEYITIATLGDAVDFGDLAEDRGNLAGCASPTRGVFAGGQFTNMIQYVQIMSKGDAIDFGDLTATRGYISGLSNGHGGLG